MSIFNTLLKDAKNIFDGTENVIGGTINVVADDVGQVVSTILPTRAMRRNISRRLPGGLKPHAFSLLPGIGGIPGIPGLPSLPIPGFGGSTFDSKHHNLAINSVTDLTNKLSGLISKVLDSVGGFDALSSITGIPADKLKSSLRDPNTTDRMRQFADVVEVIGGIVNVSGLETIDPILAGIGVEIQAGAGTLTSVADLMDSGNKVANHFEKGEYDKLFKELGNISGTLKGMVSEETADTLKLNELQDKFNELSDSAKKAQEVIGQVQNVLAGVHTDVQAIEHAQKVEAGEIKLLSTEISDLERVERQDHNEVLRAITQQNKGEERLLIENFSTISSELKGIEAELAEEETDLEDIKRTLDPPRNQDDMMRDLVKIGDNAGGALNYVTENLSLFLNFGRNVQNKMMDYLNGLPSMSVILENVGSPTININIGDVNIGGTINK